MKTGCPLMVVAMFVTASAGHAADPGPSEAGTETGKAWVLWPAKDVPYSWIELPQRKDAANVRKAE